MEEGRVAAETRQHSQNGLTPFHLFSKWHSKSYPLPTSVGGFRLTWSATQVAAKSVVETSHLINVLLPTVPAKKASRLVIKLTATVLDKDNVYEQ